MRSETRRREPGPSPVVVSRSIGDEGPVNVRKWIASVALLAYLALLFHLTLMRFLMPNPGWNLIPLRTILHDFRVGGGEFLVNTVGNVVAFVPMGVLVPVVFEGWGRSARRVAVTSLGLSLLIELAQARSGRRVADVDDLILNTLGGWLGFGVFRVGGWLRSRLKTRSGSSIREAWPEARSKTPPPDPL